MNSALSAIQDATVSVLSTYISPGQGVALVDFPDHENAGDSLIYLGELAYLERLGASVDYVADVGRYSASDLRHAVPEGPIFIHGGGNLGDRWEILQVFREQVVSDFPDRPIVQLSQTIEFGEGPKLDRAQAVFGAHPDLTLLIRDHVGVERARALFPSAKVEFCPDLAFGVGRARRPFEPRADVLFLRRQDSEATPEVAAIAFDDDVSVIDIDWGLRGSRRLKAKALHVPGGVIRRAPALGLALQRLQRACYRSYADTNVRQAVEILSLGRVVVTDRLHATVLAALLGTPVVALDNANGKVSAIIRDYLGTLPGVTFAHTHGEAEAAVAAALGRQHDRDPQPGARVA